MDQDCLTHYGVLGMKWGVRRAKKYSDKVSYTSATTNSIKLASMRQSQKAKGYRNKAKSAKQGSRKEAKYTAKAKKASSKSRDYAQRAKRAQKVDNDYLNYTKKTKVGKALVQEIVFGGSAGSETYGRLRSQGVSRGKAALGYLLKSNREASGYYSTKKKKKK